MQSSDSEARTMLLVARRQCSLSPGDHIVRVKETMLSMARRLPCHRSKDGVVRSEETVLAK